MTEEIIEMILGAVGDLFIIRKSYNKLKNEKVILPEGFTLTAHTGCEGTADNSLEAIKKGYECGADTVEFDVNFTAEGVPVLAHDKAADSTVTLAQAFELIAELPSLTVNVDCKTTENLRGISELAEKYGVKDRIFYTGIEEKDVPAVKEQTPDITYWLNIKLKKSSDKAYLNSVADKVKALGAAGLNINHKRCTKELVDFFHEKGLLVSIWTIKTEFDMIRALNLGPDNITTRKPGTLRPVIEHKTSN
ncbi:MAG: glycerophosphodiester phosphodiesterase [Clostridia bacterium]|nr:glycerophosphodiester phosphodiesterase [Clostridia bacterium]